MPMFTTLRIGLPVCPFQSPERMRSANAAMRSSTSCTCATTSTPSTTSERSRGMRSATWSTERFSVVLIRSPRNIASVRSGEARLLGELHEQPERLVGDAVLRVVEVEAGALGGKPLAARRVVGEEVAQVEVADLGVVRFERAPGRPLAERRRSSEHSARDLGHRVGREAELLRRAP